MGLAGLDRRNCGRASRALDAFVARAARFVEWLSANLRAVVRALEVFFRCSTPLSRDTFLADRLETDVVLVFAALLALADFLLVVVFCAAFFALAFFVATAGFATTAARPAFFAFTRFLVAVFFVTAFFVAAFAAERVGRDRFAADFDAGIF